MAKFCAYCGKPMADADLFCANCGKRVNAAPAAPQQPQPQQPAQPPQGTWQAPQQGVWTAAPAAPQQPRQWQEPTWIEMHVLTRKKCG